MLEIRNPQCEHPDCPWCARRFFAWLKARMNQMSRPQEGEPAFADEAATSIIPKKDEDE